MIKLSRKIEYAILAMQYIALNPSKVVPAKEISDNLHISFEFLSKTLQVLMKKGLVNSQQGINGGYSLLRSPEEITVSDIIEALEGKTSIVNCFSKEVEDICERSKNCTIKKPIKSLQDKINSVFAATSLAEIAGKRRVN